MQDALSPGAAARSILTASCLLACLLPLALWVSTAPVHLPLLAAVATILFLSAFAYVEAGLVILILSMLLSPEIPIGGGGGGGLEGSKDVILRTEDLLLLIVALAWIARMAVHKDLGAIRRTRLNALIGAYAASCLISTLIGIEAGRVRPLVGLCFVAKYVEYFFIFFITVNYVRTDRQLRKLLAALLVTMGIIVLYCFWQLPSGERLSAPFEGEVGEPNTLGGYLVMMFSVTVAIALTVREPAWRRTCSALALAAVPPILGTLSRSSWLALGVSFLVLLVLSPGRRRLAIVAVLMVAPLAFYMPSGVEERLLYTFQPHRDSVTVGAVQLDPSSSARLVSWWEALRGFGEHPILGWGVTGFHFIDAQYFRILVEIGLTGMIVFAMLLGAVGRTFHSAHANLPDPLHRALGLGMLAAFIGLLFHALSANTFILIRIMEPFWLLTGLVVAAGSLERVQGRPPGGSP